MQDFIQVHLKQKVSTLCDTALCKYIATKCMDSKLLDNQVRARMANFMSHHKRIHKEIYGQSIAVVDILEMLLEEAKDMEQVLTKLM